MALGSRWVGIKHTSVLRVLVDVLFKFRSPFLLLYCQLLSPAAGVMDNIVSFMLFTGNLLLFICSKQEDKIA